MSKFAVYSVYIKKVTFQLIFNYCNRSHGKNKAKISSYTTQNPVLGTDQLIIIIINKFLVLLNTPKQLALMSPRWTRIVLATTPGGLVSADRNIVRKIASENKVECE